MARGTAVAAALCVFAAMAQAASVSITAPGFILPAVYEAEAIISMPYADISEPAHVWYDANQQKSRIDYYNGVDKYIYRGDMQPAGSLIQLVPEINVTSCVQTNGTSDNNLTSIQGLLPDLSDFQLSPETQPARGIECYVYTYSFTSGAKVNSYYFYVSKATLAPVCFHFFGYDELFGSHYDEYKIDYLSWSTQPIDPSTFDVFANMTCGGFPGPGDFGSHHTRSIASELTNIPRFQQEADKHFATFKAKYNKSYAHDKEHQFRRSIFVKNMRFVDSVNHKANTYRVDINHLADLQFDEIRTMTGVRSSRVVKNKEVVPMSFEGLPTSFDWRTEGAVSPVKDQGICGSCWSFGAAQALEGAWYLKNKATTGVMDPMSQQALMDCSWGQGNNACDGGEAFRAFDWVLQNNGFLPSEASYGVYQMADGVCHAASSGDGAKITGYINVTSMNLTDLAVNLYQGPVSVAIDAAHQEFVFYSSGVYYNPACGNTPDDLDHEVLAIGWGVDPQGGAYWIIKNSWSDMWGNEGYVFMSQKDNNCGVATDPTRPLV